MDFNYLPFFQKSPSENWAFIFFPEKKSGKKSPSESFALNKLGTSRDFPIRDGDFLRELP